LRTHAAEIDGHGIALDDHFDADRHRLAQVHTIIVQKRFRLVSAIGNLGNARAHFALGLGPALLNGAIHRRFTIAGEKLLQAAFSHAASTDLGMQIPKG
jgi:hypothetical protein